MHLQLKCNLVLYTFGRASGVWKRVLFLNMSNITSEASTHEYSNTITCLCTCVQYIHSLITVIGCVHYMYLQPLTDPTSYGNSDNQHRLTTLHRVAKYCDIFENIKISKILKKSDFFRYFQYISSICKYIAKISNLLPNSSMCVCALHIRWSSFVIHTALLWRGAIWQKLSNTEKMLTAQVISQQNTQTIDIILLWTVSH